MGLELSRKNNAHADPQIEERNAEMLDQVVATIGGREQIHEEEEERGPIEDHGRKGHAQKHLPNRIAKYEFG